MVHLDESSQAWRQRQACLEETPSRFRSVWLILVEVLTDGHADDARTALGLIDEVDRDMASFTADAAYDTTAIYEAAGVRGAEIIV